MTKFGHRASLDLSNPLSGEIEVLSDLFERSGLSAIKTETQSKDLSFPFVKRCEEARDLIRQECERSAVER